LARGSTVIQTLLDDFNFYRSHTNHYQQLKAERPYLKLPTMNKARRQLLNEMVAWCRENNLDPRHWLYALFCRGRWLYSPKWIPGALMSKSGLEWYRQKAKRIDLGLFHRRLDQTVALARMNEGEDRQLYDPLIHTSAEVESRKARYARTHGAEVCMDQMWAPELSTQGWHPQSKVCQVCPIAERCKEALRASYAAVDLVSLRGGSITMQQARLMVAVNNGRS
jgi:hypothetical protein